MVLNAAPVQGPLVEQARAAIAGELVPIAEALADLPAPVKAIREATPQARHHFTLADQVNQLVSASEADAERGFMALCSLPRTNPGNQYRYVRRNGPYTLVMSATGINKLPFGNFPRLILAWVCTEAVRAQSRKLVLGRSLSAFMRALGPIRRNAVYEGKKRRW